MSPSLNYYLYFTHEEIGTQTSNLPSKWWRCVSKPGVPKALVLNVRLSLGDSIWLIFVLFLILFFLHMCDFLQESVIL
jgi:hypothetical protein